MAKYIQGVSRKQDDMHLWSLFINLKVTNMVFRIHYGFWESNLKQCFKYVLNGICSLIRKNKTRKKFHYFMSTLYRNTLTWYSLWDILSVSVFYLLFIYTTFVRLLTVKLHCSNNNSCISIKHVNRLGHSWTKIWSRKITLTLH